MTSTAVHEHAARYKKDLTSIADLSLEEMIEIFEIAASFREVSARSVKKVPSLRAKTVINLFFEASTRTRVSFELAAKRLSADVINIGERGSSIEKGESLRDTAQTLERLGADIIVLRHSSAGACVRLARQLSASVINAGDGGHEHPTQALIDVFTANEHFARLSGNPEEFRNHLECKKVLIVGDILHSRVARSNILAFKKFGADVHLAGPANLMPPEVERFGVRVHTRLEDTIKDADILYILRLQKERQLTEMTPSIREYARLYGIDRAKLCLNEKEHLLIMHPGPVNRDIEIRSDVMDSLTDESGKSGTGKNTGLILEQVENGLLIRMALLYVMTGGSDGHASN